MRARATSHASRALATSRARSWVSQVKPSPMARNSTWSGKASNTAFSPECMAPLMNWTTATRLPWPIMRQTMPRAAVVLPLPLPVWTMTSPRSTVLPAMIFSRACCFLRILSLW